MRKNRTNCPILRESQLPFFFPFQQKLAKTLNRRSVVIFLPDENEGNALNRFEDDKFEGWSGSDDRFCYDTDSRPGLDITHDGANQARCVGAARSDSRIATSRDDRIMETDPFSSREDDERFAREDSPGDGLFARQFMFGWNDDAESFFVQRDSAQADRFMNKDRSGERGGQAILGNHFPDALGRSFLEMQRDEWKALAVIAEQGTQERLGRWTDITKTQFPFFTGGGAHHPPSDLIDLLQQTRRFAEQDRTGGSDANHMAGAFQQRDSKRMLQLLDCAAEGWLRDVQALSRAREIQFFRNSLEIA